MGHMAGDTIAVCKLADEGLVTVAIARTEVEVAVSNSKRNAGTMEKMSHADGVASTAYGEQHLFPWREKVLLCDEVEEATQFIFHHSTFIIY